jgi:hypothetical protein
MECEVCWEDNCSTLARTNQYSILGIAASYRPDGLGFESQQGLGFPFSKTIQTCSGAHPASHSLGPGILSQV